MLTVLQPYPPEKSLKEPLEWGNLKPCVRNGIFLQGNSAESTQWRIIYILRATWSVNTEALAEHSLCPTSSGRGEGALSFMPEVNLRAVPEETLLLWFSLSLLHFFSPFISLNWLVHTNILNMLRFLPSSQNLRIYLHPYFALPYFALPKPNFTRGLCKEPHGGPVVNLGSIPGGGTNISKATQT